MSKRVALIPEELVSSYHLQKPEIRLEDDIESLLQKANLPDDMKAKLLGQLITRYHKTVHTPAEPVRVSVTNEHLSSDIPPTQLNDQRTEQVDDKVLQSIILSTPKNFAKFVPMIVEKLKSRQYTWNNNGELVQDGIPIRDSSVVDFFSYTMKNAKTLKIPAYYKHFLKAIKEINIPRGWIGNPKVLSQIEHPSVKHSDSFSPEVRFPAIEKKNKKRGKSVDIGTLSHSSSESSGMKSENKWLNY